MASNVSDDARREEILERTLMGLQEDIDDLRAELLDALPDYEQRLRQHTSTLPGWLKLAPARIRQLFHFDEDSVAAEGILGPRALALGAGRVEAFVDRWFEDGVAGGSPDSSTSLPDDALEELTEDYADLCTYLNQLGKEVRRVAEQARGSLDEWRDAVLTQLDARRETDVEALEELVREGEVGRGRNARQEIADLWEEQRHQAAELQEQWAPIIELVDEGLQVSTDGLDELWGMVERAHQGLVGVYDGLDEHLDAPKRQALDTATSVDEAGAKTVPASAGATATAVDADESPETPDDADESPETNSDADEPGKITADIDEPVEPADDEGPERAADVDVDVGAAGDTIPDGDFVHGIVPLEEPTSEPEMGALESSSVSDYSEPHLVEPSSVTSSNATPTQRLYTRDGRTSEDNEAAAEAPDPHEPEQRQPSSSEARESGGEQPGEALTEDSTDDRPEPLVSECFRIRAGYEPVGGPEIAAVLGPPVAYLLVMGLMCAAHLWGFGGVANPLTHWSWIPASLAVAAAWLFLVPFGLRWRTRWSGMRPAILRSTDVRQREAFVLDDDGLAIGPVRWRLDEIEATRLRRWDSPADQIRGWVLCFEPPSHPGVYLVAAEPDRQKWQNSPMELVEVPYEAWQLDAHDFEAVRDRLI